jgi:hypothetical protein
MRAMPIGEKQPKAESEARDVLARGQGAESPLPATERMFAPHTQREDEAPAEPLLARKKRLGRSLALPSQIGEYPLQGRKTRGT